MGWTVVQSDGARLMLWVSGEDGAGTRTKRTPAPPPAQWSQGRKNSRSRCLRAQPDFRESKKANRKTMSGKQWILLMISLKF